MDWNAWIFIVSGIVGALVLAFMGRKHVRLPANYRPGWSRRRIRKEDVAGRRIACLLTDAFEDTEFGFPHQKLSAAGFEVEVIGPQMGAVATGWRRRISARANRSIEDADPDDYVAMWIPGGLSPDRLRADRRFLGFVQEFDHTGRVVAATSYGPQLLMTARRVENRILTAWPTVQDDLSIAGASVLDEPVVVDENWITARGPEEIAAFTSRFLAALERPPAGYRAPETAVLNRRPIEDQAPPPGPPP